MAILLKGWILLICGASAVEGLRPTGLPSLVYSVLSFHLLFFCLGSIYGVHPQRALVMVRHDLHDYIRTRAN